MSGRGRRTVGYRLEIGCNAMRRPWKAREARSAEGYRRSTKPADEILAKLNRQTTSATEH